MIVKTLGIDRAGDLPADRAVVARVRRMRLLVHDTSHQAPPPAAATTPVAVSASS